MSFGGGGGGVSLLLGSWFGDGMGERRIPILYKYPKYR